MPVNSINGRFFLAIWVYFYCTVSYLHTQKTKFLFLSLIAVAIHQGFIPGVAILVLWAFTKNLRFRNQLYLVLLLASLFVPNNVVLNYAQNTSLESSSTELLENKLHDYSSEENIEYTANLGNSRSQLWNTYRFSQPLLQATLTAALIFVFFQIRKTGNKKYSTFIYFIMLFYSFVNIFDAIPSLGSRYLNIMLGLATVYIYIVEQERIIILPKFLKYALFFSLSISFLVKLRMDFEHMNAFAFLLSPIAMLFGIPDESVISFLKYFV